MFHILMLTENSISGHSELLVANEEKRLPISKYSPQDTIEIQLWFTLPYVAYQTGNNKKKILILLFL